MHYEWQANLDMDIVKGRFAQLVLGVFGLVEKATSDNPPVIANVHSLRGTVQVRVARMN